jgi:hypothetical protein
MNKSLTGSWGWAGQFSELGGTSVTLKSSFREHFKNKKFFKKTGNYKTWNDMQKSRIIILKTL